MNLTVQEHLDEAGKVHREGQEIAGVLGELKEVVEKALEITNIKKLIDRTKRIETENALPRHLRINIENLRAIIKGINDFKESIPDRMMKMGFGKVMAYGNYKITIDGCELDLPKSFSENLEKELNNLIVILKELIKNLGELGDNIEPINQDNFENTIENILINLRDINYIFEKLFLGETIRSNHWLPNYKGPIINKGGVKLSKNDKDLLITEDFVNHKFHDINSGFYEEFDKIQDLLRRVRKELSTPQSNLASQPYTNIKNIKTYNYYYKSLSAHLSYMFKIIFLRENGTLIQELYTNLKQLLHRTKQLLHRTKQLEYRIGEYNGDKKQRIIDLVKDKKLQKKETLQPTLTITRLTAEISEMIEEISVAGELPQNIEEFLHFKSKEVKNKRNLKEAMMGSSPDQ